MKQKLIELFTFNKSQRIGNIVFVAVLIIIVTIGKLAVYFHKPPVTDFEKHRKEIDEFYASLEPKDQDYVSRLDRYIIERYDSLQLFDFNPNNTTNEQWKKLGLTEKQIQTLTNYLNKGGKFYVKDDFRKIYGIRTKQYQILEPFIQLPNRNSSGYKKNRYFDDDKINKNYKQELDSAFNFDPNTIDENNMKLLGFNEKQIQTIMNYRNKGGKFYKPQDLEKIYSISKEFYQKLEPYVTIESQKNQFSKADSTISIELNSCSVKQLTKIKGVGNYYANRIIKYRDLLGGYALKEQLMEVYGMKKELYLKIEKCIDIDNNKIKKISLNFADLKELSKHPYIDYKLAKKIINHRSKKGPFKKIEDLIKNELIDKKEFDKLKHYITTY